jgi:hypothetical protein
MTDMGPKIAHMMQRALSPHRYSGDLEDSITWSYRPQQKTLRVGSELQRGGKYNALALFSRGAPRAIPNLPFTPIAKWAAFRGLPAGPIWMSMKDKGVTPHPILDKLEARPEFHKILSEGAKKMGMDILVKAFGKQKEFRA